MAHEPLSAPAGARSHERVLAALVAVVLALSYAWFVQGGGWNQNSRLALVRAIAERRELSIDAYRDCTGDVSRGVDGHSYTDKSPGPSWLAVPAYALVNALVEGRDAYATRVDRVARWTTFVAVGLPSALAGAVLFLLLVGPLGVGPRFAFACAMGHGLGTMAFPYATVFMNHGVASALALGGFALLVGERVGGPARVALAGHLLGWAAIADYATLAIAGAGAVVLLALHRRPWLLAWLALGAVPPIAAFMAYNAHCFGGPLTLGYQRENLGVWDDLAGGNVGFTAPAWWKLREITIGRYRGLLWGSPFLAWAPLGLVYGAYARRGRARAIVLASGAIAGAFLAYNAGFVYWHGGYAAGPRLLVPALPFLVILVATLPRPMIALAVLSIVASVAQMTATTAVNPMVPGGHHHDSAGLPDHVWPDEGRISATLEHYRDPWLDYTWPRLSAGMLGVNTQGVTDVLPREDKDPVGAAASWNEGERWGLSGAWQLAPLVGLWALALALAWGLARRTYR